MSRHEGVSCDSCLKGNFRGRRYKCLICYDYDLCAACYETGATTTRHTTEHPMQCILTRSDFDLYYGGEALSVEQPQAFTCPFCGKMGYTETSLHDHVSSDHSDSSFEVVCPVCAALPVGEPNHVTDDFLGHLTLEHRGSRELDDSGGGSSNSRPVRRIPHPTRGGMNHGARRRHAAHMQFASSSTGFTSLSPSNRESMDPIAELLSQLSGVRRSATSTASHSQSTSAQLQQLQMQLQLERQQAQMARQQLERLPAARRQQHLQTAAAAAATNSMQPIFAPNSTAVLGGALLPTSQQQFDLRPALSNVHSTQFLLSRCTESNLSENEQNALAVEQADHSMFVQELLLMSLSDEGTSTGSSVDTDGAIVSLLPVEEYDKCCDQQESSVDRNSNSSRKCEESGAAASKTVTPSNNELISNSSLVHPRKHASSSQNSKVIPIKPQQMQQQQQPTQPVMVVRDNSLQSPVNRMGLPTRISGSGTHNIGGGASYNLRSQQGSGGGGGGGQGLVRGGSPAGSTSAGRTRKVQRHIDDRNKSNEPPPPH